MAALAAAGSENRPELTGFVIALLAHAALLFILSRETDDPPPPEADAMEVSFVEEVGPVSSAPEVSQEPAPALGEEFAPAEVASGSDASVPDPIAPPIPEPIRPPAETGERRRPDPTRNAVTLRPAAPPRVAQVQRQQRQQRAVPQRQTQQRQGAPGPRFADVARSFGGGTPQGRQGSPGDSGGGATTQGPATSQQRASFVGALTAKIARCSRQQRPTTQEARTLRPVVVIRLRQDGSLDGAPFVRSVEGLNATNRQYETQVRDAIIRAVRNCAPYSGLPPELYDVPNGWRQPPAIRLNFQ